MRKKHVTLHLVLVAVLLLFCMPALAMNFTVTSNEGLFSLDNGTGNLETSDINLSLSGGSATSPVPTSVVHTVGQSYFSLSVSFTGILNGEEILTVGFQPSAAFDIAGNAVTDTFDIAMPDETPPNGYSVLWDTAPVDDDNVSSAAFTITDAEIGATYSYTVVSDGGAEEITGNGIVTQTVMPVTGINLSTLYNGTLTVSVKLTDAAENEGDMVTAQTSKATTSTWLPTENPDLMLWLDANDTSTLTLSSNRASEWRDKSGKSNHVIQGNTALQPLSVAGVINGRSILRSTLARGDRMLSSTITNDIKDSGAATIFTVAFWPSQQQGGIFELSPTNNTVNDGISLIPWGGTMYSRGPVGSSDITFAYSTGKSLLFSQVFSATAEAQPRHKVWMGGTLRGTQNAVGATAANYQHLVLFCLTDGSYPRDQDLGEMIVYSRTLSDIERQKVEGYLAHKWGLTADLPNDHPYKDLSP